MWGNAAHIEAEETLGACFVCLLAGFTAGSIDYHNISKSCSHRNCYIKIIKAFIEGCPRSVQVAFVLRFSNFAHKVHYSMQLFNSYLTAHPKKSSK